MTPGCFCGLPGAVVVTVRGNVVTRRVLATGDSIATDLTGVYPTVDGMFAVIAAARASHAAAVEASYDARYGFPKHVFIDEVANVADDEINFDLRDFVVD